MQQHRDDHKKGVNAMAFFDKLKKAPESNTKQTGSSDAACAQKQVFIFEDLPESLAQMQAMPEAALTSP